MQFYTLDNDLNPVQAADAVQWARWYEGAGDQINLDVTDVGGDVTVATYFLGVDPADELHEGPPVLWGTKIFGLGDEVYERSYATLEDARAGHDATVEWARSRLTEISQH